MSKIKKNKSRKSHPYSSYLKEIRPNWKSKPEIVKPMIMDMIEKRGRLIERPLFMVFVERFLGIHKKRIARVHPELFEDLQVWAARQTIQYYVELLSWFTMNRYNDKYWVSKDFHLGYIGHKVGLMENRFLFNDKTDTYRKQKAEILEKFQDGTYPDPKDYTPFLIAIVLEMIYHYEFLKAEEKKLLQTEHLTTVKVPVELKNDHQTHKDYLHVNIPPGFFKTIQQNAIREELKSFKIPAETPSPVPKLYTRKETAELMQVSLPKLDEMTKNGTIICHRIGDTSMKRYKWGDIQASLEKIETEIRRKAL